MDLGTMLAVAGLGFITGLLGGLVTVLIYEDMRLRK
jgi:hypothetical protein